jgi:thiol-disulfide isomerase/thioredoxin
MRARRLGNRWSRAGILLVVIVLFGATSSPAVQVSVDLDFQAVDLKGRPFQGLSLKGQIVLLDFWAVWCPPCIAAIPTLNRLSRALGSKGFRVVGVAVYSGGPEDVAPVARQRGMAYTVVVGDDDLVERFEIIGFPTYVLIGPDGNVYCRYVGELAGFEKSLKNDVSALSKMQKRRKGSP